MWLSSEDFFATIMVKYDIPGMQKERKLILLFLK
jgi:hypothetical protein